MAELGLKESPRDAVLLCGGIRKAGPLLFDRCADPAAREQRPRRGLCGCFDSQVDFGARVMAVAAAALTDRLHWRFARLRSLFALFGEGRKGNFHVGELRRVFER